MKTEMTPKPVKKTGTGCAMRGKLIDELREVLGQPNPKEANHG